LRQKLNVGISLVILGTWGAEVGRIMVPGQSSQKVCKTPSQPIARRGGIHLSSQLLWNDINKKITLQVFPGELYLKNNQSKKRWKYGSSSRVPA
jgi:hypothetical protein